MYTRPQSLRYVYLLAVSEQLNSRGADPKLTSLDRAAPQPSERLPTYASSQQDA